jgi:hypothetical protein
MNFSKDSRGASQSSPHLDHEDELATAFPGREIVHEFRIKSDADIEVAINLLARLQADQVILDGIQLKSLDPGVYYSIVRLKGISPTFARMLAARLSAEPGVIDARVEHHLVKAEIN